MYENEATFLYDWTQTSTLSYGDFLRAKSFEGSIRYAIDDQTRRLVASNKELAEKGIQVLSDDLAEGFSAVSERLDDLVTAVDEGLTRVFTTLHWGFAEVLTSLGRMNDSLETLVRLARTPSQTWSYEQFEIARDELRRGLYAEALVSIDRAINGYGSNPGFKSDFRFHFLLGTIKLGSYKNSSVQIVDPADAERAFTLAARYAQSDHPEHAGIALICAGRASYVQKKNQQALDHTETGLTLAPKNGDGWYQFARLLLIGGHLGRAKSALKRAINEHSRLAIHAAADQEFLTRKEWLNDVLQESLEEHRRECRELAKSFTKAITSAETYTVAGLRANALIGDELARMKSTLSSTDDLSSQTLIGCQSRIGIIRHELGHFPALFERYRIRFVQHHENLLRSKRPPTGGPTDGPMDILGKAISFGIGGFILGLLYKPRGWMTGMERTMHGVVAAALAAGLVIVVMFGRRLTSEKALSDDKEWRNRLESEIATVRNTPCPDAWKPLPE